MLPGKRLVVCADDFGQSEPVDSAIVRLATAGRLTAVSCLSQGAAFSRDLPALLATGADAGLHLDLTEGSGGAPPEGLGGLILRSHLGALDGAELRRRIGAQLDAFERAAGRPPAFVDGHRHVHQLPLVRAALLDELAARGATPFVRATVPARWRGPKAALIAALGGRALRRALAARGLPHNRDFAGVYGFEPGAPYRALVQGWLASVEDGALLMCHPGEASDDVISAARVAEAAYLGSEAFLADCAAAGVARVGVGALTMAA
ncbi:MAG TPA: ChbG/HpnK family deacetylase [Anaeromyxobacteraceae bacterium]|nr:ChbG/HpnK family deacetylase [Anaeromyxobacteraceae bacterium]